MSKKKTSPQKPESPFKKRRGVKPRVFKKKHGKPVISPDDELFLVSHVATLCGEDARGVRAYFLDFMAQNNMEFVTKPGSLRSWVRRDDVLRFLDDHGIAYELM